jgi:hypothetical protein
MAVSLFFSETFGSGGVSGGGVVITGTGGGAMALLAGLSLGPGSGPAVGVLAGLTLGPGGVGVFGPNDAGKIGEEVVTGGGSATGSLATPVVSDGGSEGMGISSVAFGSDGFSFPARSLACSVICGGGNNSGSFVGKVGGKVKMDGDGSFFTEGGGNSSG